MMRTIEIGGTLYEIPAFSVREQIVVQIDDGPLEGTRFILDNMQMDAVDDEVMHYDLDVIGSKSVDEIKPVVDNIIIAILHDTLVKHDRVSQDSDV